MGKKKQGCQKLIIVDDQFKLAKLLQYFQKWFPNKEL